MRSVSDDEAKHIITASNVHKRLSFRGREKFVEVFSQGKNNYRWTELSQLIATPVDQAISWSSSDEELEDAGSQQRGRHLPNRTLTSHINFDDCKLVRRRGHRHSSAQFVRSVEKRPRERPKEYSESPFDEKSSEFIPSLSNMPDTTFGRSLSPRASESIHHCDIWERNLSILNRTVNLTPDFSETPPAAEKLDQHQASPKGTISASKIEATSPILATLVNRNRRRRKSDKKELKAAEESGPVSVPEAVPSSPIFKTGRPVKGHAQVLTKTNPSKLKIKSHNKLIPSSSSDLTLQENELSGAVIETAKVISEESSLTLLPKDSCRLLDAPASPVIGRAVKRQKRMVVDKDVSPILGSKSSLRPFKIPKVTRSLKRGSRCKTLSGTMRRSLKQETDNKPSNDDMSLLNEARLGEDDEMSSVLASQCKAAAKRSLDFSFHENLNMNSIIDCDSSEPQAVLIGQNQNLSLTIAECDNSIESQCDKPSAQIMEMPEKNLHVSDFALNKSDLIEDVNTEQIDVVYVNNKPDKSLCKQKVKKLSLRKKSPSKNMEPTISISSAKGAMFSKASPFQSSNMPTANDIKRNVSHGAIIDPVQSLSCAKKQPDQTFFIEEDLSEPTGTTIPETFGSPISSLSDDVLRNHIASLTAKLYEDERDTSASLINPKNDDADIDSCSSQSPEVSQQEIERLPSSSMSTSVAISQTSTPPARCNINGLPTERSADNFNAPPKKGKTKLKPDGLANRLQRLLNRQRSSARIWQFKRSKQNKSSTLAGCSEQSSSLLLAVDKTWTEYSHIVVQGHVSNDSLKNNRNLRSLADQVIVVLDPTITEKLEKIMSASQIRIFPPWQSLKLKGISLILCAYCIEVVPLHCPSSKLDFSKGKETESSPIFKEGLECVTSTNLVEIIFPKLVEIQTHLIQYTEVVSQEPSHERAEDAVTSGSISSLVSHHYIGEATSDILTLTILRAFQFRPPDAETGHGDSPSWSLLGQDMFGEVCEVLLGCDLSRTSEEDIWEDIKTGKLIGKTYCFSGFLPIQRIAPFRVSNLWKIISSMGIKGLCDQPVFYILSPATLSWSCKLSETQRKLSFFQPTFYTLASILSETSVSEARRVNIFCCILHATQDRLYITDVETSPNIIVITVNKTAYIPPFVFKAAVLIVLDLEVTVDEFRIDKYSKLSSKGDVCVSLNSDFINDEQERRLASLDPTLPLLRRNTPAKTLAMFFGMIVGVDEETAYMWPACGNCENELLSLGDGTENYRCEKCNNECIDFIKRMSLQVLCTCPNLPPNSSVRIKLHQSTIESLLPPVLCNEEGYDMNSVIGKKLGPLRCEVLHSKDGNFTLQELPKVQ